MRWPSFAWVRPSSTSGNYAAAAQSFRDALDGATDLTTKWTEVWSHIYLGRIYDIQGDRTRAVNEIQ